jgi:hypothetical protein
MGRWRRCLESSRLLQFVMLARFEATVALCARPRREKDRSGNSSWRLHAAHATVNDKERPKADIRQTSLNLWRVLTRRRREPSGSDALAACIEKPVRQPMYILDQQEGAVCPEPRSAPAAEVTGPR